MQSDYPKFRELERNCRDLAFLWWDDADDRGVFITRFHFDFMTGFYSAIERCETFGEFWKELEVTDKEYVGIFLEAKESRPADNQMISDLRDSVFIFCEPEFPITQCVEQTYTLFRKNLPKALLDEEITTEYGEKIGFFDKTKFVEMSELIKSNGFSIEHSLSPFDKYIFDYGD